MTRGADQREHGTSHAKQPAARPITDEDRRRVARQALHDACANTLDLLGSTQGKELDEAQLSWLKQYGLQFNKAVEHLEALR